MKRQIATPALGFELQSAPTDRATVPVAALWVVVAAALIAGALAFAEVNLAMERAAIEGIPRGAPAQDLDEDTRAVVRALQTAHVAALRSGSWARLIEVGDAVLRIGRASSSRAAAEAIARKLYTAGFFRARRHGSLEGVLRATEAFAALGDREVVEAGLRIAGEVAADAAGRERVREAAARLTAGGLATGSGATREF